jgi:hypothetical protein
VTITFSFKTAYLQGHLVKGPNGQKLLEITTQSMFTNIRDRRSDYQLIEDFQLQ